MSKYETILATTDLSEGSVTALRHAAQLAKALQGEVVLLYCLDDSLPPVIPGVSSELRRKIISQHRKMAQSKLEALAEEHLEGCRYRTAVVGGSANHCITEYAQAHAVDLIVLASQGRGFLGRTTLGSTAHRVLHGTPCPVLVIPSGTSE